VALTVSPTPSVAIPPPLPPPPAVTTPAAKSNCNPPYTLDPATGKKHFKVECL
jgi:hypothetical protein